MILFLIYYTHTKEDKKMSELDKKNINGETHEAVSQSPAVVNHGGR